MCKACFICKTPPKIQTLFYSSVGKMGLPQLRTCVFGECVDIMKCTGHSDACYIVTLALCRYLLLHEYWCCGCLILYLTEDCMDNNHVIWFHVVDLNCLFEFDGLTCIAWSSECACEMIIGVVILFLDRRYDCKAPGAVHKWINIQHVLDSVLLFLPGLNVMKVLISCTYDVCQRASLSAGKAGFRFSISCHLLKLNCEFCFTWCVSIAWKHRHLTLVYLKTT